MIQGLTTTQQRVLALLRAGSAVHVGENTDVEGHSFYVFQLTLDRLANLGLVELDHNDRSIAVAAKELAS